MIDSSSCACTVQETLVIIQGQRLQHDAAESTHLKFEVLKNKNKRVFSVSNGRFSGRSEIEIEIEIAKEIET